MLSEWGPRREGTGKFEAPVLILCKALTRFRVVDVDESTAAKSEERIEREDSV